MTSKSRFTDLATGHPNRRQVLNGLASVGIVAGTVPLFPRRARAEADLSVFTWADYDNPMFHEAFVAKHGASPEFSLFGEEEEALQKLRGGFTPDVAHPCTSSVRRWKDAGILRPLDTARIEQWESVFPSLREIDGIQLDGAYFHMPWDWGNESILYRTDLVEIEEDSYSLLLDERYRGRMAMYDSVDSMAGVGGVLAGVKDPFNMTDEEIERTKDVWRKIHANMRFYWTDNTQAEQALASGELVAAWSWNEAVVNLKAQGLQVEYMHPKEGIFTWVCGLSLIQNGPGSEDQAYDFLNAMLDPHAGKNLITEFGYGHSNQATFDLIDPARLEELGISSPKEMMAKSNFYEQMPADTREKLIQAFEQVKAGL